MHTENAPHVGAAGERLAIALQQGRRVQLVSPGGETVILPKELVAVLRFAALSTTIGKSVFVRRRP